MNIKFQPQRDNVPQTKPNMFVRVLWFFAGYWVLSCLTIPFAGYFWLGEIPVLAAVQIPKIFVADWLRKHVVMKLIVVLGFSSGSFSPDYGLARPYALAIAYLLPIVVIGAIGLRSRFRLTEKRFVTAAFIVAALTDYIFTLIFGGGPGFTVYG